MKKLAVLVATVAMLSVSCVTAFAASSPEVKVECSSGGVGGYAGYAGYACPVLSTTSAKTGVTADPAIFAALGVVACGGIAVVAKKKMHA